MSKTINESEKLRILLPYIKDMIAVLSAMSMDAAELELSDNLRSISRQIRELLILEGMSKQYRKLLVSIRLSIKDGKSGGKFKSNKNSARTVAQGPGPQERG